MAMSIKHGVSVTPCVNAISVTTSTTMATHAP